MGIFVDFSQVTKALEELSKKASKNVIDKALDAGSEVIINAIKEECPFDNGDLQASIGEKKRIGAGLSRVSKIGVNSKDKKILARGFYQEYGTKRMSGKKFMKRSFQTSVGKANKAIIESLENDLLGK